MTRKSSPLIVLLLSMFVGVSACSTNHDRSEQKQQNQEQETSQNVYHDSLVVSVNAITSQLPLSFVEGDIHEVDLNENQLTVKIVMDEEPFMAFYSMTPEERENEKKYFYEYLNNNGLSTLVKQCEKSQTGIHIVVVGITSQENFSIYFSPAGL